jgi:pyruvate,orthophosphate dikinase
MLQTRRAERTATAAVKIAVHMAREGLISRHESLFRVDPLQVYQLLLPRFDEMAIETAREEGRYLTKGLNASPGAATGLVVTDPDEAERLGRDHGKAVVLVREETSPDDVHGMLHAKGILTARGGATSHAAVVARGLGLPCVAGCESLKVDSETGTFSVGDRTVRSGEVISIDGGTGEVFLGSIPLVEPNFEEEKELIEMLSWADREAKLEVWANADYPRDAERSRKFGARGIGLCRTEHMFFEEERLPLVQKMILAKDDASRQEALDRLLPIQRSDFKGILEVMGDLPVVIRLIDPPLHEFLPKHEVLLEQVTKLRMARSHPEILTGDELEAEVRRLGDGDLRTGVERLIAEKEELLAKVTAMRETNPMLGLRGCRLSILFPQITEMQVRAIFEAACELKARGVDVHPEIMIPLVGHVNELRFEREKLEEVARRVMAERGVKLGYKFGTMIEIPRAALTADEIARHAEFFSFGTNDLTQTTFGYSRDDAEGKFLIHYVERKILPANPFQVLDRDGVGQLMRIAVQKGRMARPDIILGICGEHGGDPQSIEFCHELGLDYVSCSPFRVPVARLAAAHSALKDRVRSRGAPE